MIEEDCRLSQLAGVSRIVKYREIKERRRMVQYRRGVFGSCSKLLTPLGEGHQRKNIGVVFDEHS